jgi:tetratricopeptide (TPR) repeat protein
MTQDSGAHGDVPALLNAANAAARAGNLDQALERIDALLALSPRQPQAWLLKADILKHKSDLDGVHRTLRTAAVLLPDDQQVVLRHADIVMPHAEDEALRVIHGLAERLGPAASAEPEIWWRVLLANQRRKLKAAGVDPDWARSDTDAMSSPETADVARWERSVLERESATGEAEATSVARAIIHMARAELEAADRAFAAVGRFSTGVAAATRLAPGVYESLGARSDEQIAHGLPAMVDLTATSFADGPIIFLCCDFTYFNSFASILLRSLARHAPGSRVHVHVIDGGAGKWQRIVGECAALNALHVAVSAEASDARQRYGKNAAYYYHAVRFIRLYQLLQRYRQPMWMMDVDALFNRDPRPALGACRGHDVAVHVRPQMSAPWQKMPAGLIGVLPTEHGLSFARTAAAFLAQSHQNNQLCWYIDQAALYGTFNHLLGRGELRAHYYPPTLLDQRHGSDGIIWFAAGGWKFALAQLAAGTRPKDSAVLGSRYAQAMMGYLDP